MISNIDGYTEVIRQAQTAFACPECQSAMKAAEVSEENGIRYTWYVCSRENCGGQWLQKEAILTVRNSHWEKYRTAAGRTGK